MNTICTKIFYINLDHRQDKNKEMLEQFQKSSITNYERFPAIYEKEGCVGCTKSHIAILQMIKETYHSLGNFIILEDDFSFHEPLSLFETNMKRLIYVDFDVILLASNTIREEPYNEYLNKCLEAQTTAGYLVNGRYVDTLLQNFEEGLVGMQENFRRGEPPYCAIDQYWKRLQQKDRWFIFHPKIGYQRPSLSDISLQWTDSQKRY